MGKEANLGNGVSNHEYGMLPTGLPCLVYLKPFHITVRPVLFISMDHNHKPRFHLVNNCEMKTSGGKTLQRLASVTASSYCCLVATTTMRIEIKCSRIEILMF